jgi:hypothetical protein
MIEETTIHIKQLDSDDILVNETEEIENIKEVIKILNKTYGSFYLAFPVSDNQGLIADFCQSSYSDVNLFVNEDTTHVLVKGLVDAS